MLKKLSEGLQSVNLAVAAVASIVGAAVGAGTTIAVVQVKIDDLDRRLRNQERLVAADRKADPQVAMCAKLAEKAAAAGVLEAPQVEQAMNNLGCHGLR